MGGEDGWGCWVVGVRGLGFRCFEVIGLDGEALAGALAQEACHCSLLIAEPRFLIGAPSRL